MIARCTVLAAAVFAAAGLALAQPPTTTPKKVTPPKTETKGDATLKVGSKAPALKADKWVKGSEVKSFQSGKVYVVEFWATWCPPCRDSIPHLTELQKAHKELTVIGMASSERKKTDADTRLEVLQKFVQDQGDKMSYTVAYDGARAMADTWMKPANQQGIPCAFIVGGDGKIAFIGHPMNKEFETAVENALKAANGKT